MSDDLEGVMQRSPPYEAWFVVEVDMDPDRDNPLYTSITGPFPSEECAEHERDEKQAAWEEAIEEWDDEDLPAFMGWDIVPKYISDHQMNRLERQDEEFYRAMTNAANAVGASLLADEGIGPLAGDQGG